MKKAIAIATAITIAIIVSVSFAIPAHAERSLFYTLDTVIVGYELSDENWLMSCLDNHGDTWQFYDEEPWHIGDIVTLKLFASGASYYDDEVVDVEYGGNLELHELAKYILRSTGE